MTGDPTEISISMCNSTDINLLDLEDLDIFLEESDL